MPRGRPARPVVAVLVATGLLLPFTAATAATEATAAPVDDLDRTRDRLTDAERGLDDARAAVRAAADELAVLDDRLSAASTRLTQLNDEVRVASDAAERAREEQQHGAAELAAASEELEAAVDDLRDRRSQVEQRAIEAYKLGSRLPPDLVIRGVGGASDLHEVAVAIQTVGRLVSDDREASAAAVVIVDDTAHRRGEVYELRLAAQAATAVADERHRELASLQQQQHRLVDEVAQRRQERADVVASLESDAKVRAALVRELQDRVEALERSAAAVRVPVRTDVPVDGPAPAWASALPPAGRPWAALIDATAARYGLDGRLLAALVWTESNFRPDARSHAGAIGLAQLMPATARGLGVDPHDPVQNLDGGARYLAAQLDTFGSVELALAAYNAGPGRVHAAGGVPAIVETQLYVVRVLDRYGHLGG
ncbi:transglycosylase SLT domain-containing protein [Egicoccus sp. AB-alg2]|uniref:transglycosylase SLT domain-containing protein n=1 Tax=Egicoccus sp. AB-alg2 TaxID=3242693 RepID=UPI00359E521F